MTHLSKLTIKAGEISIPYTDFGGSGSEIHFLHANGYPPECYKPLATQLTANHHVVGMHLRPLWAGSAPEGMRDWREFSSDFLHFLDIRSAENIVAIGHSLGGVTALRSAIRNSQKFRALVLIEPVLFRPVHILYRRFIPKKLIDKVHPVFKATKFRRRTFQNKSLVFESYRKKDIFRFFSDENLQMLVDGIVSKGSDGNYHLAYSPEWEFQIYQTGIWNDLDIWRNIRTLPVPTLIIRGDETDTFLMKNAAYLTKRLPNSRFVNILNSTHLVPLERPEEVNQVIQNFLQEIA